MIANYYSGFSVFKLLSDKLTETICNHFTSVLAEYGLTSIIVADFGTQHISRKIIEQTMKSPLHSIYHIIAKQIAFLREPLEHANHCGINRQKIASVFT